jgi:hypothetical protein
MAEDNTPLIAAISAADVSRRRRIEAFVQKLLGEAYDDEAMDRVFPEASGRGWPVDTAVFYYPGLNEGLMVYGPISVKDMLDHFFKETLPGVMPEASEFKNLPSSKLAEKALAAGMVVLFGENGKLNQVMSRRGQVKLPDGGSAAEDAFDSAESSLVYMSSPGNIAPHLVGIGELLPQLKWLASVK